MTFSDEKLGRIWDKTGGYCAYCGKKISWANYGNSGRGSWEVDHSKPKSKGGTDHINNLVPACTSCNREKGDMTAHQYKMASETASNDPITDIVSSVLVLGGFLYLLNKFRKK